MKAKSLKFISASLLISSTILYTNCSPSGDSVQEKITFLEKHTLDMEDSTLVGGDAHGGKYFSRADSANVYGKGMIFNIVDSLLQKDVRVKLNGWVRIGDLSTDKKFAFSLEDGSGKSLHWTQIDFRSHVSETNKWVNVKDSVTIPGNLINQGGMIIKTYSYNPDGKSTLDCDDIELSYNKVERMEAK
jgi:hypothetical protein